MSGFLSMGFAPSVSLLVSLGAEARPGGRGDRAIPSVLERSNRDTVVSASQATDASNFHPEKHWSQITSTDEGMESRPNRSHKVHGDRTAIV
jgi:hypothetical protein